MTRFSAYLFLTIGLLATLFFMSYHGTEIPNKELWIVFSIFFVIIGGFLIVRQKFEALRQNLLGNNRSSKDDKLVKTGEQIRVTLDNCEIKTRSFQQEVSSDRFPSRAQQMDALFDRSRNYQAEEIRQTYILFKKQYQDKTYNFISQPTTVSPEELRKYLDHNNGIDLYIDRDNPNNYYFDIYN